MRNLHDALASVITELTPQPWEHTTPNGRTITVIPAGLRADAGTAEVYVRITVSKTIAAEAAITTTDLPALITVLSVPITQPWDHQPHWPDGSPKGRFGTWLGDDYGLSVAPADGGFRITVAEDTDGDMKAASITLPDTQRLPLASALGRALDVARGWEDDA